MALDEQQAKERDILLDKIETWIRAIARDEMSRTSFDLSGTKLSQTRRDLTDALDIVIGD